MMLAPKFNVPPTTARLTSWQGVCKQVITAPRYSSEVEQRTAVFYWCGAAVLSTKLP